MRLDDIWVVVRSSLCDFGPSHIVSEADFHRMLFTETCRFYPVLEKEYANRVRGYVSFSKLIAGGEISLDEVVEGFGNWAGYSEEDKDAERDMETVSLVKASLLNPHLLLESKAFVQELSSVEGLPFGERPANEAAMAGYKVACDFGVYEGRAFTLVDEMYKALRCPQPNGTPSQVNDNVVAANTPTATELEPWLL